MGVGLRVTREEIERIARLASLAIDEETLSILTEQIATILEHVARLDQVEQSEREPEFRPGRFAAPLREDGWASVPLEHPPSEFAPELADGFFVVPRLGELDPDR